MARREIERMGLASIILLASVFAAPQISEAKQASKQTTANYIARSDMELVGSSCPVCLMRIEKNLRAEQGVIKAAVSIYKPYPAVIIYDASKTSIAKITHVLTAEKVKITNLSTKRIEEIPLILVAPKRPS